MSKELAKANGQIAQSEAAPQFDKTQEQLLREHIAPGLGDAELIYFSMVCRQTKLDPFKRQIWPVMRNTYNGQTKKYEPRMTIQTGIDGYRAIAHRTSLHAGCDAPLYLHSKEGYLISATITVYRMVAKQRCPFTATAFYAEYVQTKKTDIGLVPNSMWATMPLNQLAKCAEALALRKAFPEELAGVYVKEEMDQMDNQPLDTPHTPAEEDTTELKAEYLALIEDERLAFTDDQKNKAKARLDKNPSGVVIREYISGINSLIDQAKPSTIEVLEVEDNG